MHLSTIFYIAATFYTAAAALIFAPLCQEVAPTQTILNIQTANLSLSGTPFGVVYARPNIAFVAIENGNISVLNTSNSTPTLIRKILIPSLFFRPAYGMNGLAISHDKRTLYAAVGPGAVALEVEKAITGEAGAVVGFLNGTAGLTAIEVTVSLEDDYIFVSEENGNAAKKLHGSIEVFQVNRPTNGTFSSTFVRYITLGISVVGSTLSKDGSKLYVTSEKSIDNPAHGSLSVLDVANLKKNPSQALLASADAGCAPVRVELLPDGKHAWVNARESNMLLGFDTANILRNSSNPLVAVVQVGTAPVSLAFVNEGRYIITADSNRFGYANATTGLTVVDVEAALKGKQGFPRIPTGLLPRELSVSQDGKRLLVSEYSSEAVQSVNISELTSPKHV